MWALDSMGRGEPCRWLESGALTTSPGQLGTAHIADEDLIHSTARHIDA